MLVLAVSTRVFQKQGCPIFRLDSEQGFLSWTFRLQKRARPCSRPASSCVTALNVQDPIGNKGQKNRCLKWVKTRAVLVKEIAEKRWLKTGHLKPSWLKKFLKLKEFFLHEAKNKGIPCFWNTLVLASGQKPSRLHLTTWDSLFLCGMMHVHTWRVNGVPKTPLYTVALAYLTPSGRQKVCKIRDSYLTGLRAVV